MKKKIKEVLKQYGHTMIKPSWYRGDKTSKSVIFNTFDSCGIPHAWYVRWKDGIIAHRQMLSAHGVHDHEDTSYMFEGIER